MTAPCRLQRADVAHTQLLAALYGQCFDEPWTAESMAAVLASPGAFALIAVAEPDGVAPIGFVLARHAGDEVEVISLGVLPTCRRQNVGGRLLDEVLLRAVQAGAGRVVLEVAETNEPARALYLGRGFRPVGRRPDYYQRANTVPVAALTMARDIGRGFIVEAKEKYSHMG